MVFKNNTIIQTFDVKKIYDNKPMFEIINSKNVEISGNKYEGKNTQIMKIDEASKPTLKFKKE